MGRSKLANAASNKFDWRKTLKTKARHEVELEFECNVERGTRFELATFCLEVKCSPFQTLPDRPFPEFIPYW